MKAIVCLKYGPPEVAHLVELEKPVPKDDEILLKVFASTVNRTDSGFRSAQYFISRFWSGLLKPKHPIFGCEFAGKIEAIGKNVTLFTVGDAVFGYNDKRFGGHGEFLCVSEKDALSLMPSQVTFETAAAITEGAHYALSNIRAAQVKPNQSVLVYGATGAIGSAAVQLLKHFGAEVTAVCNTQNVALVEKLGADYLIDYQTDNFTKTTRKFDFIFDAVGKSSFGVCKTLLTEKGIYISTELGKNAENIFYALLTPFGGGRKVLFPIPTIEKADVEFLKSLVENGEFLPVIDRSFSMDQIVEAYRYVESGQKTGNVVLKVCQ